MSAMTSDDMPTGSNKTAVDSSSPGSNAHQSIQARKTSRKSAILRREILSSETDGASESESYKTCSSPLLSHESNSSSSTSSKQDSRISPEEYENKLLFEKEEWSRTRRFRSNECQELKSRKPDHITAETCADFLTDADRKFILERPHYPEVSNDLIAFYKEVFMAVELKKKLLREEKTVISDFDHRMEVVDWEVANKD